MKLITLDNLNQFLSNIKEIFVNNNEDQVINGNKTFKDNIYIGDVLEEQFLKIQDIGLIGNSLLSIETGDDLSLKSNYGRIFLTSSDYISINTDTDVIINADGIIQLYSDEVQISANNVYFEHNVSIQGTLSTSMYEDIDAKIKELEERIEQLENMNNE